MLAVTVRCDSVGTLSLLTSHYHSGHKGTTGSTQSREHCSQSTESTALRAQSRLTLYNSLQ